VSIGYLEALVPTVGVIYDPSHDLALCGGTRRGASAQRRAPRRQSRWGELEAATVECGWSTRRSTAELHRARRPAVMEAGCAMRRVGSGALGLA
jgi:myo-inositol-1(or 4)-monophosphatase